MGRPRTVNRDGRPSHLPPTPPREPDCSPTLDLGEFDWLMSPSASGSASTCESPLLMPLPTFDAPLWDALGFPTTPLSALTGALPSPGFPFEGAFPPEAPPEAPQVSPADALGADADVDAGLTAPCACFCDSTPLIDALRATLRSRVGAEDALRAAARTAGTCERSRACGVCAADPSTPIAAFTVLSLVAQILGAAVDGALAGLAPAADARRHTDTLTDTHTDTPPAPSRDPPSRDPHSTGTSPDSAATCSPEAPDAAAASRAASPAPTPVVPRPSVQIGAVTLPGPSAGRVLLVALQDALRTVRAAGQSLGFGDVLTGLERQTGELDGRIAASLGLRLEDAAEP